MKIGLVECRYKTPFIQAVAQQMHIDEETWLVQNSRFSPHGAKGIYQLNHPAGRVARKSGSGPKNDIALLYSKKSDRFSRFYGAPTWWHNDYYNQISIWLEKEAPNIVLGELGSVHSHLVALACEHAGIPFLNPSSSRYPPGRFAVFLGTRMIPLAGSAAHWSKDRLQVAVNQVNSGRSKPDYMNKLTASYTGIKTRALSLADRFMFDWYETPSLRRSIANKNTQRIAHEIWETSCISLQSCNAVVNDSSLSVLYPLQMQPEMNLDIWGHQWIDQSLLIKTLAISLQRQKGVLVIKPNPKSNLEIDSSLNSVIESCPNIIPLSHTVQMADVQNMCDITLTVSGSIAIEKLLHKQPVAILLSDYAHWLGVPSLDEVGYSPDSIDSSFVERVVKSQNSVNAIDLISHLVETSYPGLISDPVLDPNVMSSVNVRLVAQGLCQAIAALNLPGD